jgi:hypothetical protein
MKNLNDSQDIEESTTALASTEYFIACALYPCSNLFTQDSTRQQNSAV